MSQKGAVPLPVITGLIGIIALLGLLSFAPLKNQLASIFPKSNTYAAGSFLEEFNGNPLTPQPFLDDLVSADWDVAVHSRDIKNWLQLTPFHAQHGPDCSAPIDANEQLVTHHNDGNYHSAVFKCRDHIMTTVRAGLHGAPDEATSQPGETDGYAVIYLTPNQIADFNEGEVVISWDMSTLRTSTRDWIDIWITPYDENLQLPLYGWLPDLVGEPKRSIHINMNQFNGMTVFEGEQFQNFQPISLDSKWWETLENKMTTSPKHRSKFELRLSKNRIKFSMPEGQLDVNGQPVNGGSEIVWIDKTFTTPLDWDKGVVQLGHHSYNPSKDCIYNPATPYKQCYANTWHWDNISISKATPFTIIKADRRYVSPNLGSDNTMKVNFDQPAPANAKLRFSAVGTVEYSLDNGQNFQYAPRQLSSKVIDGSYSKEHASNYFFAVPEGTQSIIFRLTGDGWYNNYPLIAKDFSFWSANAPAQSITSPSPPPIISRKPGDIDGNNIVNIFDYNEVLTNFGKTSSFNPFTDLDGNGRVDIFDYNILLTNFGL